MVALISPQLVERLAAGFRRVGDLQIAESPTDLDPLSLVRSGGHLFGSAQYFATPAGDGIGGLGTARRWSRSGRARFQLLQSDLDHAGVAGPLLFGFSFAPDGPVDPQWAGFGAADMVLPQVSVIVRGGARALRLAVPMGADPVALLNLVRSLRVPAEPDNADLGDHVIESHPHVSDWKDAVAEAVAVIHDGALRKVVLSRSVTVRSSTAPDGLDLVHQLSLAYPRCYPFAWIGSEGALVGASPELLLSVAGDRIVSNPLAGSAPRGEGENDDRAIGERLMASDKDRLEHAFVVDDISARLGPHVVELAVPPSPALRRMTTVQHLSTEIVGRLRAPLGVLDLVDAIHPTPAVGGTPTAGAEAFIAKVEAVDRGWYTGGVGWVDADGDGEVAIALRCGLIRGATAHLFAGAGIVADSEPDKELAETRLKFRPLLELLAAT
jgi:salicylate biosynthesis isochorismate synthase